jgi:hypothetical protein
VLPQLSFLWCYGVFHCSIPLRVIIVFGDSIYVIITILYSWHLVICEHFWLYVWNNWSWVMHTMSTWFWHKNWVWQVHSTLDTFKTDLQNTLPRQIRSVVQQDHGESQGKQLYLEPSTPYPSSTSAPGNTCTLYPSNTTASGNPSNIASTSTLHPGNISGNVIFVDASSPYPGDVSMGKLGTSPTANLPYLGARPLQVTQGFLLSLHRPTQTQTFSNRVTKPWLTVPTYLPRVRVFLTVLFPTYFSLGHWLTLLLTRG